MSEEHPNNEHDGDRQQAEFERRYGTRDEVWANTARQTRGGLTRDKLMLSRSGRLVSKLKSEQARENYKKFGFKKREVPEPEKKKKVRRSRSRKPKNRGAVTPS
jgi:hypothetical protein